MTRTFMDRAVDGEWPDAGSLYGAFAQACGDAEDAGDLSAEAIGMTETERMIVRMVGRPEPALAYIVERRREERRLRERALIAEEEARMHLSGRTDAMIREKCGELIAENAALRALVTELCGDGCPECGRDTGGGKGLNEGEPHMITCSVAQTMGWATA